ncbi:MAG: chemotaxis protein MotB [Paracoccaceae bacterium]|nr:chemotaxis protein MotB [Paracoccaceae bacterium]MDE3237985.1 chemotaxis protein MotB [Paracoccaceae bacterium]
MARQNDARPVIIKRKKIVEGGGHHGGAWKVAYADFVTAMMTFFLLMWLLNATTDKQRKGIADYFSPTIPINRVSGGGSGAFGGESVFSEKQLVKNGTGASNLHATESRQARGATGLQPGQSHARATSLGGSDPLKKVEDSLMGSSGESDAMKEALRHVVTRVTDQGLVIDIFDLPGSPLFVDETARPEPVTREIAGMLARVFRMVVNPVALGGHVRSYPVVLRNNPVWALSMNRAEAMRDLLQGAGFDPFRIERITGYADRKPAVADPQALRNNRLEVTLLRMAK